MSTTPRTRFVPSRLAAALVACVIICFATAAPAQQAAKVQSYTVIARVKGSPNVLISPDGTKVSGHLGSSESKILHTGWFSWSASPGMVYHDDLKDPYMTFVFSSGAFAGEDNSKKKNSGEPLYIWTQTGGIQKIEVNKKSTCSPNFVSADGSVVAGYCFTISSDGTLGNSNLFRWSRTEGMQDLGNLGAINVVSYGSADGSVLVGSYYSGENDVQNKIPPNYFRWTRAGGFQTLPFATFWGMAVSSDGSSIIGMMKNHVIRWTQAGGAQDLGELAEDGNILAVPSGVSDDGSVIVGSLYDKQSFQNAMIASDFRAVIVHGIFRWTQADGLQELGNMGGSSASLQISADGNIAVGQFKDNDGMNVLFITPMTDLLAKAQDHLNQAKAARQAKAQALAKAQAEQQAQDAAKRADQQARYDKAMHGGRPAQLYALAGDLEEEGRPEMAADLYQALIDNFPDDPFTAKAIDKREAARTAARQQQIQQQQVQLQSQQQAQQAAADNATHQQAIADCQQQCNTVWQSCRSDAKRQSSSAVVKGVMGALFKNAGMVGDATSDASSADDAQSACDDAHTSCTAACQ